MMGTCTRDDGAMTFQASSMKIVLCEDGTLKGETIFLQKKNNPIIAPLKGKWGNGVVHYTETYRDIAYKYEGVYTGRSLEGNWVKNSKQDPGAGYRGSFHYNLYSI